MRAQESISFMIVIGGALLLFSVLSFIITDYWKRSYTLENFKVYRESAEILAKAIYYSSLNGDGTEINVSLSEGDYVLYVKNGYVVAVNENNNSITYPTNAFYVNETVIYPGYVNVKNEGGIIYAKNTGLSN